MASQGKERELSGQCPSVQPGLGSDLHSEAQFCLGDGDRVGRWLGQRQNWPWVSNKGPLPEYRIIVTISYKCHFCFGELKVTKEHTHVTYKTVTETALDKGTGAETKELTFTSK
jgi:hypothetical protein